MIIKKMNFLDNFLLTCKIRIGASTLFLANVRGAVFIIGHGKNIYMFLYWFYSYLHD